MKKTLILSIMACLMIYGCKPGSQMHTTKSHEKYPAHEKHTGRSMHEDAHKHGQQKEPEDYVVKGSPEDFMITVGDRILFGYDSDQLSNEEKEVLDHQISWLLEHDNYDIKLEGHCDERGTREYNIALGERRAHAIKTYLVDRGINPKRIKQMISYGKDKPAVEGNNEEAWRLNRRVVLILSKQ